MSHAAENSSSDEVSEAEDEFEIESVEGIRTNRESQEPEFLVRWKGHWPGEAYTWIPKEAVKNCPKLVDYYIRSNPHLTHPEAKARRAKLLKGKGKPKELVSDLQEQSRLIISHIDGGLWYAGRVDKVIPGNNPHMLMQLDGHAAVPRSLADKSIRAECSKAIAETEEMALENKRLLNENKKLRLVNDAVSNKLRTMLSFFRPPGWQLPTKEGSGRAGKATVEELAQVDLQDFVTHFQQHPAVKNLSSKPSAVNGTGKRPLPSELEPRASPRSKTARTKT